MWIKTASGDLVNLTYCTRLYLDARNKVQASFASGDVEIMASGPMSSAALFSAVEGHLTDYFDVIAEADAALPCGGGGTVVTWDPHAVANEVRGVIPNHAAWSAGYWTLTASVTGVYTIQLSSTTSNPVSATAGVAVKFALTSAEVSALNTAQGTTIFGAVVDPGGGVMTPTALTLTLC